MYVSYLGGPDVYGHVTSQGYNLIGKTAGSNGWLSTDIISSSPLLGPLADNGGPTQTMALQRGSPAINAGTTSGAPSTDQRGFPRDANPDIGAYETVQADLQITKTDGKTTVVPGTLDTYTIVVTNAGPSSVTGATVADSFPATLAGVTFTATQTGGALGFTASGNGSISDTVNMPSGSTITYTAQGNISPSATGTLSNTATVTAPVGVTETNTANNSATDSDTLTPQTDLQIAKTDGQTTAVPGNADTYTILVTNAGPSTVTGAKVADTFPVTLTGVTFTATQAGGASGFTASGSGKISDTVNMPVGSTITYTVHGTISPSASGTLSNTATVTAPAGVTDTNTGNNTATDSDTLTPQADLQTAKTDGKIVATPGTLDTYTIMIANAGPSNVTGATVTDTFPAILSGGTFTATQTGGASGFTASGNGNISDTVNMPAGSTITYTVVGTISRSATGTLSNTATVTVPAGVTDTNTGNNSATDNDTLTPQADLQITKTDGKTTVVPGSLDTYTIVVTNAGPSDITGATVADTSPATLNGVTFAATQTGGALGFTANGSGNISDTVNMPTGSTITYTVVGTISPSATGTLSNTATVTVPAGVTDTNTGNNSATDSDTLTPQVDLQITKTDGKTTVVPGTSDTYTIVVTNAGPSDITGGTVVDAFPATLSGVTFTATQTGGALGFTASGSGNISDTVNMPTGSTITYTVVGRISPSATGTLSNTATVTVPAGVTDTNTGNNSATDSDTLTPQADLQITKTDGKTTVVPGTSDTYTIVVTNAGPSDITGGTVVDAFPATLSGVTFTATQTGGALGFTASGSGNISDTVNMPTGSTITYTVASTISPSASGTLSNTATVTAPAGVTDTNTGNNSATDSDTLTPQADLQITKTDGNTTVVPGTLDTYTIVVSNAGPSNVTGATVADTFSAILSGVTFTAAQTGGASGFTASGNGNISDTVNMPAGSTITYRIATTISPSATGTLSNTATVAVPAGVTDTNTGNNSATDSDTLTPQADLQITTTDGQSAAAPGVLNTYTIIVTNAGPSNVPAATFTDSFPATLTGVTFTATQTGGASGFTASGSGDISDTVNMLAGSTITYTVQGTISPSATGTLSNTATVTAPLGVTDANTGNNSATDTDTLIPPADLQITNTPGQSTGVLGTLATYTIVVTNAGPSNVPGATVEDRFPATLTGVTFTATQAGGASGFTTNGSGSISDTVSMPPGSRITYTVQGTMSQSAPGTLSNTATVTAPVEVKDTDVGNNSATAQVTVQGQVITLDASSKTTKKAQFTDTNGDIVTAQIGGKKGKIELLRALTPDANGKYSNITVSDLYSVMTDGTDPKTTLTLTVAKDRKHSLGDGVSTLGKLTGSDPLGSFTATNVDLTGAGIQMTGTGYIGTLALHDLKNGADISMEGSAAVKPLKIRAGMVGPGSDITTGSPIGNLKLKQFAGTLTAPWTNAIFINGDFTGAINLGQGTNGYSIKNLSVVGNMDGAKIQLSGSVATVTAGAMENGSLLAGFTPLDSHDPMAGGNFAAEGTVIGSVKIKGIKGSLGKAFTASYIAAGKVGSVKIVSINTQNGGQDFGIVADQSITSVSSRDPNLNWKKPTDMPSGDFCAKVL